MGSNWEPEVYAEMLASAKRKATRHWLQEVYGPGGPESARERRRRWYIRQKAARLGISESRAAAMTKRQPLKARRGRRVRNDDGTFAGPAGPRQRAPIGEHTIDSRAIRAAMRQRAIVGPVRQAIQGGKEK